MRKPKPSTTWLAPVGLTLTLILAGCATQRTLRVETTPSGATVFLDRQMLTQRSPITLSKVNFTKQEPHRVRVEKENYEPQEKFLSLEQALTEAKSASQPWVIPFTLVEIKRQVPVQVEANVEGYTVAINDTPVAAPTAAQILTFTRASADAEWSTATIRVEKSPSHKTKEVRLRFDDVANLPKTAAGAGRLAVSLDEIRREVSLEVKANVEAAEVFLQENKLGTTPLKATLIFTREDGSQPWSTAQIKVQKEGYEYRPAGRAPAPAFVRALSSEEAAKGLNLDGFVPVRFYITPVQNFAVIQDKLTNVVTNVWAEVSIVGNNEAPGSPVVRKGGLIISRFCIVPDSEKVVFSMPRREIRQGTEAELVGASIMVALGPAQQTSLTDGRDFAVDPFVTADAKWIYFSSDRLRTRSIWRMPASGSGGLTRITGFTIDSIDSEPALSPDRENPRLAYTSRLIGSPSTSPSYIWLASADGKLPTQLKPGRSPAWSPDGKKLAYVSPEQKIWTMTADGSEETILTKDESHYSYPVWVPPDGKYIVYASDQAPLTELGVNNMDIWIMGSDGTNPRQLTTNGSLDSAPAVSSDGKFLYFFSNRGAAKAGEESLQIFRMELKVD